MLDTPFWQSRNAKLCVSRCYKKNALSETAMQLGAMWDFRLVKETRQVGGLFVNSFAHNPSGDKPGRSLMETETDMKLKTHASGERKTYLLIRCCWKNIWKIDLNMLGGQGFSACSMLKQGTWTGSHLPHPAAMPRSGWWGGGPFCARRTMGRRFARNQTWESCPRQMYSRYSKSMVNCHELALLACHHLE